MNEKQFGILPTKTLFFKLAIPGLLSMVFSSISMVVDGIFVGRFIGSEALAAINLAIPILIILFAISDTIAIGFSVKISIKLGEKEEKSASRLFSYSLLLIISSSLILGLIGLLFSELIVNLLISDQALAESVLKYLTPYFITLPLAGAFYSADAYLRVSGMIKRCMFVNISVAILNIVLDAFLIGYLGYGIEFAAWATSISMSFGAFLGILPFVRNKKTLKFTSPKVPFSEVKSAIFNGSSEFFSIIADSIMMLLINGVLLAMGGTSAVAAYAIAMYIHSVFFSILYGIQDSIQPAVSYNYGANLTSRCFSLFRITSIVAFSISLFVAILLLIFPNTLVTVFADSNDQEVIEMAKIALLLGAPGYLFAWINMVTSCFLTGFDRPKESISIMISEAFVFPILSILIAGNLLGLNGIFLTPAIGSALASIVALILWYKISRKIKKKGRIN